jgi:cysteine desulfurase/selenocysteine lyase
LHAYDLANALAAHSIAVRAGQHCAMPLLQYLNIDSSLRVSLACYNTKSDIDALVVALLSSIELLTNKPATIKATKDASQVSIKPIESQLTMAKDWNEKHRLLLLHSRALPVLPPERRLSSHQINGCEANVWIATDQQNGMFLAYSDSKVVRGLLSLLLNKVNDLDSNCVSDFNFESYFDGLGLTRYFSQGRKDGMQQIVKAIRLLDNKAPL